MRRNFALKSFNMNTILWIGQVFLAVVFLYSGVCKSVLPEQKLIAKGQTGVAGYAPATIHFIGVCEILGAMGIVLPWLTGILPVLTPLTALCFAIVMLLAAPIHYRLKEPRNVAVNLTILVISLAVAWGRWRGLGSYF
jgi:uncharacterized membrane protein YphA (DoxX/SURF4 family)